MDEQKIIKENQQSVKFSINSKGLWSGECKVYDQTPEAALQKATEIGKAIEVIISEKNGGSK